MIGRIVFLAAAINLLTLIGPTTNDLWAVEWKVQSVDLGMAPRQIVVRSRRRNLTALRIETTDGKWHRLTNCGDGLCVKPLKRSMGKPRRPRNSLPDGVVTYGKGAIRKAWLSLPTQRYRHGALGDDLEASAIDIVDDLNDKHRFELGLDRVFEDLKVRIIDVDDDGDDELVVVLSLLAGGASLAVLEWRQSGLALAARTPEIGVPFRWLNPAGAADFDGDGRTEIAVVVTPHIGGRLEFWEYGDGKMYRDGAMTGFSNHVIGSRALDMSAIADFNGDGRPDLMLPASDRRSLRLVSLQNGQVQEFERVQLGAEVVTNIFALKRAGGKMASGAKSRVYVMGLADGTLAIVH